MPAGLATLAAGAVMMTGGYLFGTDGWAVAGPVMLPAGAIISIAFALARRAKGHQLRDSAVSWFRVVLLLVVGVPCAGGDLSAVASIAVSVVTLLAGAVMVVAGYAAAKWNLLLVPPTVVAAGAVIGLAFGLAARSDRAPIPRSGTEPTLET